MKMKKFVAVAMAGCLAASLAACGSTASSSAATDSAATAEEATDATATGPGFTVQLGPNPETLDPALNSAIDGANTIITIFEPLLLVDENNEVVGGQAESWEVSEDGLTWTFKIREGVKWVDMNGNEMADLTAQDFLTAMEWTFNFHKNSGVLGANLTSILEGASEYYEYTKSLSTEEAYSLTAGEGSVFRDTVKIEAPDDYTLIFHCLNNIPYFDDLAVYM